MNSTIINNPFCNIIHAHFRSIAAVPQFCAPKHLSVAAAIYSQQAAIYTKLLNHAKKGRNFIPNSADLFQQLISDFGLARI